MQSAEAYKCYVHSSDNYGCSRRFDLHVATSLMRSKYVSQFTASEIDQLLLSEEVGRVQTSISCR